MTVSAQTENNRGADGSCWACRPFTFVTDFDVSGVVAGCGGGGSVSVGSGIGQTISWPNNSSIACRRNRIESPTRTHGNPSTPLVSRNNRACSYAFVRPIRNTPITSLIVNTIGAAAPAGFEHTIETSLNTRSITQQRPPTARNGEYNDAPRFASEPGGESSPR